MINQITFSSYNSINVRNRYQQHPNFQGAGQTVSKYVRPIDSKHIGLIDTISEFFKGVSDMLLSQYKKLSTQSESLLVENKARPIPEAAMKMHDSKMMIIKPHKFYVDNKQLELCTFELEDKYKNKRFDIVLTDNIKSPQKGDLFLYNYHRADKHPIRDEEINDVNKLLDKYSNDITRILRKYQKKLS